MCERYQRRPRLKLRLERIQARIYLTITVHIIHRATIRGSIETLIIKYDRRGRVDHRAQLFLEPAEILEMKTVRFVDHMKQLIGLLYGLYGQLVNNRVDLVQPCHAHGLIGKFKAYVVEIFARIVEQLCGRRRSGSTVYCRRRRDGRLRRRRCQIGQKRLRRGRVTTIALIYGRINFNKPAVVLLV